MKPIPPERLPVIVGIGEILDRHTDVQRAAHPLQLIEAAIRRADTDAGGNWLAQVDRVDIANLMSWPYLDLPGLLRETVGLRAETDVVHGPVGGESPVRYLQEAALALQEGSIRAAIVCGGEALASVTKITATGAMPPWPARDVKWRPLDIRELSPEEALRYGLRAPADIYPLYENATRAHWRQSFDEAQDESAQIWASFSQVAANNSYAWIPQPHAPEQIRHMDARNRPIAWPYAKLMIANNTVNQAAAVLLTTLGAARAAGIAEERIVHIWDGASSNEPRSILARDRYDRSSAQDVVLQRTLERNALEAVQLDSLELYSCFPCVPKMARRTLGLALEDGPFTVAGGLTFFGAPLNGYMVHAATAMVRRLRDTNGAGLLYGQGEFVTKHHALVLARQPPPPGVQVSAASEQALADSRRGVVPELLIDHEGEGHVESYTVFFERDGRPREGVVIARTPQGARFLARVPRGDATQLAAFIDPAREPVGTAGRSSRSADGKMDWSTPA